MLSQFTTRPPTRPLTTTEEMARSLERIAAELATLNLTLDRVARALGAGSRLPGNREE